jgi:SAM-dependent methyltransferase
MHRDEYERMAAIEDEMWWFRALHANLIDAFARYAPADPQTVVDAGCGTGGLLRRLRDVPGVATLHGVELDAQACELARARTGAQVVRGSVNELPFANTTVDAVFSADVLCHAAVDPSQALAEARRCLRPGGLLLLNLPAYPWLHSSHDERVHNARRFTKREAVTVVRRAGFHIRTARYWNSLLFPVMAAHRVLSRRSTSGGGSDVFTFPPPADYLFGSLTGLERAAGRVGVAAPFGGSILIVADKP